jgi:hypothetical protein
MTVWSRAFLQPSSSFPVRSGDGRALRALAILLEGRIDDYRRLAPSLGLPASAEEELPSAADASRLAQALLAMNGNDALAMKLLADLRALRGLDAEVHAVAAILQGIQFSIGGRPDLATAALRGQVTQKLDARTQALLLLHLGLRSLEAGGTQEAMAYTQDAESLMAGRPGPDAYTLRLVAAANALQISWLIGQPRANFALSFHRSPLFAWIFGASEESLSAYLDESFTSFFEDPHSRTVKFAIEDAIDVGLSQALLRCEAVAYRQGIIQYRRKLGRYRLLTEAGGAGPAVSTGFELLRRAGDDKGLRLAIRTFRASGPLEVLRIVGLRATRSSWLESELRATLEVIGATAFTFDDEAARAGFDRLMKALPDVVSKRFGGGWLVDSGFRALGGLLPLMNKSRTNVASEWLRVVAGGEPSALVHQSMQHALHSLNWKELDRREREGWLRYVRAHLTGTDDRLFPARSAALELASLGSRPAVASIYSAYRQGQSRWLTPLVLGMNELREVDRKQVADDVLRAARRLREQAHEGQFSLGGPEVGRVLAQAAQRLGGAGLYDEIGIFVMDDAVPLNERVVAALNLLDEPDSVPKSLRRILVRGLPWSKMQFPLAGDSAPLEMVNLRLRAAFGRLAGSDVVATLVRYANDPRAELRANAAYSARELARFARIPIGTLLLSLSHDPVPEVRGSAGRGLARIRIGSSDLDESRQVRVLELLQEPGELVPIQVWAGVADSVRQGDPANAEIAQLAKEVAAQHVAQTVRIAASAVVLLTPPLP